ncbi:TRAP transporter permease [Vibrio natriegens]|uniref:Transporter n=3 Tax=Vibrio natriegens TaxID=691 RepID=A0AAN0Y7G9_VIBNA|nr:TRAP transporter fused permease subunit [Vibrio natriegens]ALR17941.1 transporter [Vibrio natriegens NBRC 15636 = ATCC 14048 = DSM 759]ANQ15435.1 transporter [Vibrio natriegens NBRC 15636 = ATCC 14048 = DSM 759]EPM41145.1 transporter [Vibrio natriegens NBRC 15636 = ATCC 14048 = DSM 759]MDX6029207.1 TRAP transporter fused permease subunit [Vibrio natriegens NBRC 15636 = ATCC 14048 = DSM 759]UUI14086.1 TRAP transporter fused permease subunit [Vibrio natriegens]
MKDNRNWNLLVTERLIAVAAIFAVSLSAFQIWQGITASLAAPTFRPIHISWVLVLVFLVKPTFSLNRTTLVYLLGRMIDLCCMVLTIWATWRISVFDYDDMSFLMDGLQLTDIFAGVVVIAMLLEATRRTVGAVMSWLAIVFILYAMFGSHLPDAIASKSFSIEEMIRFHIFSTNGVYGAPLGIAAGVVFTFVLFGAFLQVTGAGQFFIDCAFALAGKYRGGPAKASVIASAALGSISGSAIANTVTTGSLTIPMMKKLGYRPEQAAGIEAAASTGGQIMPPVMGAGAFVMAQFTGIAYSEILLVSIVPAILYFLSTLLYIHLMACKLGLKGMAQIESIKIVLVRGWHFLAPLVFITVLLMLSYSPVLVGIAGCGAILAAAMVRKSTRVSLKLILQGMKEGALMALPISVACACAGIIVGVIGQTGIGLQFTQFLLAMSGGQLWSVLGLVALAALVLGMGLPVTAAYIVLSVMAVPALTDLGVSLLAAHMIVFWLSQTSNITPPIALAAFAGAGIANASPMKSAIQAMKLAQGFFLIPIMMAHGNLIWFKEFSLFPFVLSVIYTLALIVAFAGSIEGRLFNPLSKVARGILFVSALVLAFGDSDVINIAATVGILLVTVLNQLKVLTPLKARAD